MIKITIKKDTVEEGQTLVCQLCEERLAVDETFVRISVIQQFGQEVQFKSCDNCGMKLANNITTVFEV